MSTLTHHSRLSVSRALFLVLALFLVGCDSSGSKGDIVIGGLFNTTGEMSSLDISSSNGALLAIKEVNDGGGINGQKINYIIKDGHTDPSLIQQVTSDLLQQHPVIMSGFEDSDSVLSSAPLAQRAGIPYITPGASSPRLPSAIGDMMFLACFGDNVQAAVGAEFMYNKLSVRKVGVMFDTGTEYTRLLAGYFKSRWVQLAGNDSILDEESYQFKDTDFSAQISRIKHLATQPDALYIAAMPNDIPTILKQLRAAGITLPVIGGDGYDTPDLLAIGTAANNVYYTTHALVGSPQSSDAIKKFSDRYKAAYNADANAFSVLGYDTAMLMVDAIKRAGSTDPQAIKKALEQTTNFPALSGSISFQPASHIPNKEVTVLKVNDGKLELAAQLSPTLVPAP